MCDRRQHLKCPKPILLTAKNHEKLINDQTEAVIFVREPLERLLAGYRMMFNHPNVTKQNYDLFIRPILNKVRFEGKSVMPKSPVDAWEKGYRMTFAEFVNQYILSDSYLKTDSTNNDFWRTQTDNCNLCSIKYTFVGKVNTFATDIRTRINHS